MSASLSIYPKEEAYIDSDKPDKNFSNSIVVWLGKENQSTEYRVLLKFNCLERIPKEADILSAKLRMYVDCAPHPKVTGRFAARLIESPWKERDVTWNSCPSFAECEEGGTAYLGGIGWYEWDMTKFLRIWHRDARRNQGVLLLDTGCGRPDSKRLVGIKNTKSQDIHFRPCLQVCYDMPHKTCDKVVLMARNFIEKTTLVKTSAEFLPTNAFNTSQQSQVTFFIKNIDHHPAEIMYEVGPDEADYVLDDVIFEVLPGETIAVVPRIFGKYTRLLYRSKSENHDTVLKVTFQSHV